VNGKVVASFKDQRFPSGTIALTVPTPATTVRFRSIELKHFPTAKPPRDNPTGQFVTLFDGRNADRWRTFEGGMPGWDLKDGCLVSDGRSRLLYSDTVYQNFHVRAEVLVSGEARAAIGMRSPFTPDLEGPQNYSVVITARANSRFPTGSVQDIATAGKSVHGPDEWVKVEAICFGTRLITRVNGLQVVDIHDRRFHGGRLFLLNLSSGVFKVRKVEIREFPPTFINALGMEFARIPPGKSWLGGGDGKGGNEAVEFKEDFYLGVYEVTQEEWAAVMGMNPSRFSRSGERNDAVQAISDADLKRFPVENISRTAAQHFLELLNERAQQPGWVYRLPTDEEWEYACRGGPIEPAESGFNYYLDRRANILSPEQANFEHGSGLKRTCRVGSYSPNRLGLHDMHGNAWELCHDPQPGKEVPLMRGGSWQETAAFCRASSASRTDANARNRSVGLRVARVRVTTDRRPAK
jgi:formylglycine-generating enzyme required for sulfatase activity